MKKGVMGKTGINARHARILPDSKPGRILAA
jgi:hypothetical protein